MEHQQFEPPSHLSPRATALWRSLVPSRARSPARLALLQAGLEAWTVPTPSTRGVAAAGMTTTTATTKAVHVHPLVKVEREARAQFAKIFSELSLGYDQSIDGVPLERAMERLKEQTDDVLAEMALRGQRRR